MRGTQYSRWTVDGHDNPLWKWASTMTMLAAFLQDSTQSPSDKDRAAEILKWCVERDKENPEMQFWTDSDVSALWEWSPRWQLVTVVVKEGVTRRECVCVAPLNVPTLQSKGVKSQTESASEIGEDNEI